MESHGFRFEFDVDVASTSSVSNSKYAKILLSICIYTSRISKVEKCFGIDPLDYETNEVSHLYNPDYCIGH